MFGIWNLTSLLVPFGGEGAARKKLQIKDAMLTTTISFMVN
jgi:hypothetical protein